MLVFHAKNTAFEQLFNATLDSTKGGNMPAIGGVVNEISAELNDGLCHD